jgi:putative phosphoesterase
MVKFGIISDTHITPKADSKKINGLLEQLKKIFNTVDEIIHVGDICDEFFFKELVKIAPVKAVRGDLDNTKNLVEFLKFSVGLYNIGVIHEPPKDIAQFIKLNNLNILIFGHSHHPIIKETKPNILLLNPGSPTEPKAPPQKKGFKTPVARPSVMILSIDEKNLVSTYLINLKL